MVNAEKKTKEKGTLFNRVLSVLGVLLCLILIPILVSNVSLIVQSYTNTEEVPKLSGYSPLIVLTGSMEPAIDSGDLIIVRQIDSADVAVGDIIAFFDPASDSDSIVTHRVTDISSEGDTLAFTTKGDANNVEDSLQVPSENLVGLYYTKINGFGNVAMFMQTTTGLVVCVVLPLILLVAVDVIRHRQFERQNQQDTAVLLAELEKLKAEQDSQEVDSK